MVEAPGACLSPGALPFVPPARAVFLLPFNALFALCALVPPMIPMIGKEPHSRFILTISSLWRSR